MAAACRGVDVVGRPLEQRHDLLRPQVRPNAENERGRGRYLRRGERRPLGTEVGGRAARVALIGAGRVVGGERARERREDPLSRCGDVDVEGVAVREGRDGAVPRQGADAQDVGQGRRVVRIGPGRARRLRAVPDRGDDDSAFAERVLHRRLLERRVRVAARVDRIADAAEAQVDHTRALVCRPADRGNLGAERHGAARRYDLRDDEPRVERHPRDPLAVVERRSDQAGDEGSMTLRVPVRRAADEAPRRDDLADEVGMRAVDPRVDDGHLDRREVGVGRGRPVVEGAVLLQVPLPAAERIAGRERRRTGRGDERAAEGDEQRESHQPSGSDAEVPATRPRPGASRAR